LPTDVLSMLAARLIRNRGGHIVKLQAVAHKFLDG